MRTVLFLLVCLAFSTGTAAQEATVEGRRGDDNRHAFGAWGGVSFGSPTWWGVERERAVLLVGLRYRRTLARSADVALAYTFDVIPAAAVINTPTRTGRFCCSSFPRTLQEDTQAVVEIVEPSTAYGFGAAPLGFQLDLFRRSPVYLVLGGGGGLLLFDRDVPRLDTRKMNFTATLQAGLHTVVFGAWELTLGYTFHHLSNAGTGTFNPGLDSHMVYLGWMLR